MKAINTLIICVTFFILNACSTWQEPQIQGDVVEIFVPIDSLHSDIASQLFYWYHVEGAAEYQLQIVRPGFDQIYQLMLDTNTANDQFQFTLNPGVYQWRVRAFNNSSTTPYTTHTLYIDSTIDLSNQSVILNSPKDRDTSNHTFKQLDWQKLYNAENYLIEIFQPNVAGQLVQSTTTTANFENFSIPGEGNFEWRVKGINSSSQTIFSTRDFYVDTTAPTKPILLIPAKSALLSAGSVNFLWSPPSASGSSIRDTLYVAKDSTLLSNPRKVYSINGQAVGDTFSIGTYYWRVQSFDKAGNTGPKSFARKFTIQ